jgi:hypothetical protein
MAEVGTAFEELYKDTPREKFGAGPPMPGRIARQVSVESVVPPDTSHVEEVGANAGAAVVGEAVVVNGGASDPIITTEERSTNGLVLGPDGLPPLPPRYDPHLAAIIEWHSNAFFRGAGDAMAAQWEVE